MTHPIYQSSVVSTDGTKVILRFDQTLSTDTAPASAFSLEVDGVLVTIDAVSAATDSVELTLQTAIQSGQTVAVSYTDPTVDDDAYAIQSSSTGEDADSFSGEPVTNDSTVSESATTSYLLQQIGADINGEAADDNSGSSLALSSDGQTVAIGAQFNDGNGSASGHVRIYRLDGTDQWVQLGGDIDGEAAGDVGGLGDSVSLSSNGNIVAFGSYQNDNGNGVDAGHVRIFQLNSSNEWEQLGSDVDGEASYDESGISVSLSDDGYTVAIGAHRNDGLAGDAGHVRIFQLDDSNQWVQLGSDIDGEIANGFSGRSVSLSSDGQTVAIGALGTNSEQGQARVFRLNGSNEWVQLGQNLDGEAANSWFGSDVSLSSDGNVLAVGANRDDSFANDSGQVKIFALNQSDQWEQLGQAIDGESSVEYAGGSVSLSADGTIVAIGATHHDNKTGKVRIYQLGEDGQWLQIADIEGQAVGDHSGSQVSLSDDGLTVAISAQGNDTSGNNAGHVRIYQLQTDGSDPDAPVSDGSDPDGPVADESSADIPVFQSASTSTDGTKVILTYDQDLSPDTAAPADFDLQVDGSRIDVSDVMVNGTDIELTLASAIQENQTVTLTYTDPTDNVDDDYAIQSSSDGSDAASLNTETVTNLSEVAPPIFQYASTSSDGTKVILTYDQDLSYDTADPAAFDINVDGTRIDVSYVMVYGTDIELTLASAIQENQTVTLTYTDPTDNVDDDYAVQSSSDGTDAASLNTETVTNLSEVAPPVFQSASTTRDGTIVILTYDQDLSYDTADPAAFDINVDGTRIDVSDVMVYGSDIELTLVSAIQESQAVTLTYTDPTVDDDDYAIQSSTDGTDAASLNTETVTNLSEVAPPVFQSASTTPDGTKVILTYDQDLSYDTADPAAFDINVDGTRIEVFDVMVNGSDIELSLVTTIKSGQAVRVGYTDPTVDDDDYAIQQLNYGADAASFSNASVTNISTVDGANISSFGLVYSSPEFDRYGLYYQYDVSVQINATETDGIKALEVVFRDPLGEATGPASIQFTGEELTASVGGIYEAVRPIQPTPGVDNIIYPDGAYFGEWIADKIVLTDNSDQVTEVSISGDTNLSVTGDRFIRDIYGPTISDVELTYTPTGVGITATFVDNETDIAYSAELDQYEAIVELYHPGNNWTRNVFGVQSIGNDRFYRFLDFEDADIFYANGVQTEGAWYFKSLVTRNAQGLPTSTADFGTSGAPWNSFILDKTAPVLIVQDTNMPVSDNRHVDIGEGDLITVQFNVQDALSATSQIKAVFESPSGAQTRTIIIDPSNLTSEDQQVADNIFRKSFGVSDADIDGGSVGYVEGGQWSIKELTLEDGLGNVQTIAKDALPADLSFTVNNFPTTKPALIGQKLIGQTLTIDESAILDADNDVSGATNYQYQWLISDDDITWTPVYDFSATRTTYDLEEADANKYFKSIVKYTDGSGNAEIIESDSFKFTEYRSFVSEDTFDSSSDGWVYADNNNPVDVTAYGALGRLGWSQVIEKNFALPSGGAGASISFDYRKFYSWDPGHNDHFSVLINDQEILRHSPTHENETIERYGSTQGFDWSISSNQIGSDRYNTNYVVDISLPSGLTNFEVKIKTNLNEGLSNEWAEVDNFRLSLPEFSISGPEAAPVFSSPDVVSTVEKDGPGTVVYQSAAVDQSRFTYSLEGADPNLFSIDSTTGVVQLLEDAHYATRDNYNFTVRATDVFGNFSDKPVSLAVEDSSLAFWKDGGYRVDNIALQNAAPSANALILKDGFERALSDDISRSWNAVEVIKANSGYRMLQIAERGRLKGQYRIAELNADGVLQSVGAWVDQTQAIADRYQELFEVDLNDDGEVQIPVAVDLDLDGFADGLDYYRLIGSGKVVDFTDPRGRTLTPNSSRNWNAVASKEVGDGFKVLIQGLRGRRASLYQVWSTDGNGKVIDKSSWLDERALAQQGYESTFNQDFNQDTFVGDPVISESSDSDGDGFVDGLGHYKLMGLSPSTAFDFIDSRGRVLSSGTSRNWDALHAVPNPDDPSSGFDVLIQGERGRRRSFYQVWSTDANGQVNQKTSWLDANALVQQGYESTFNKDFNGDDLIGAPSGLDLRDDDLNGLVDGISHYALLQGSGDTAQSIDLKDSRGRVLSDASSRRWNVIQAEEFANGNGFNILVQGERGRRSSQYLLWKADQTGSITDRSRWQTGEDLAFDGYEPIFGVDFNNNGSIGI